MPKRLWVVSLVPILLAATAASAQNADVIIELDKFGVGGTYRAGDIASIRLLVTSMLDEPTPCWVQWEVPNAEGDIAEYGRSVTLSPGVPAPVWLYAPIEPLTSGGASGRSACSRSATSGWRANSAARGSARHSPTPLRWIPSTARF